MTLPSLRLSAFLPYIMPFAPGCPRVTAENQLRLAAIEFCERTWLWRRIVTIPVTTNPLTIPVPPYTALARLEDVRLTDQRNPLEPVNSTEFDRDRTARPETYTQINPRELWFAPFEACEVRIEMSLKPANGDEYGTDAADPMQNAFNVVPPFLMADHLEAIKAGALARILMIPDEPFTDPATAGVYAGMFESAIFSGATRSASMKANAPKRVPARFM
jgi:hypothetical protein